MAPRAVLLIPLFRRMAEFYPPNTRERAVLEAFLACFSDLTALDDVMLRLSRGLSNGRIQRRQLRRSGSGSELQQLVIDDDDAEAEASNA